VTYACEPPITTNAIVCDTCRRRPTRPAASARTTSLAPAWRGSNACGLPLRWIGVVPPGCRMRPLIECPVVRVRHRDWHQQVLAPNANCGSIVRFALASGRSHNWTPVSTWKASTGWRVRMPTLQSEVAIEGPRISTMRGSMIRHGSAVVCAWLAIMCGRTARG